MSSVDLRSCFCVLCCFLFLLLSCVNYPRHLSPLSRVTKVHISEVPDDEVFKICLEFYHHFSQDLYQASPPE